MDASTDCTANVELSPVYSDTTQFNSTSSWVASAGLYRHFDDADVTDPV